MAVDAGYMYVYYCRTYEKAVSGGGEREKGGHVLRDTVTTVTSLSAACTFEPESESPTSQFGPAPGPLAFGGCAFPPVSLGPAGDCPCKD